MGTVRIIESVEDNFQFDRAFVAEQNREFVARAIFGGRLCDIETKPGALADGIALCVPVDGTDLNDWPVSVIVEKQTADGERYTETMWNFTANPRVVAAARKFEELLQSGIVNLGEEL